MRDEDYYEKAGMNSSDEKTQQKLTKKITSKIGEHHVDD
jgi:hypothetical protein